MTENILDGRSAVSGLLECFPLPMESVTLDDSDEDEEMEEERDSEEEEELEVWKC